LQQQSFGAYLRKILRAYQRDDTPDIGVTLDNPFRSFYNSPRTTLWGYYNRLLGILWGRLRATMRVVTTEACQQSIVAVGRLEGLDQSCTGVAEEEEGLREQGIP
jgi:hypothetical protein